MGCQFNKHLHSHPNIYIATHDNAKATSWKHLHSHPENIYIATHDNAKATS
jgi:hypothetical protein